MIHGMSEDVRTAAFLGGIFFFILFTGLVIYVLLKLGHSVTKAVSVGVIVGTWGMVVDLMLTFPTPVWWGVIGLTVLPAAAVWGALDLLATWESVQKGRKK